MDHSYRYSYGKVRLFPLLHEYIEPLRRLRNTNRFCFVNQQEVSPEDQEQWYQNYLKKTNDIMFGIEKSDVPGEFVGAIAIYDIDTEKQSAEIGRTVIDKEKCSGYSYGTEATMAICAFAFDVLKLKSVQCISKKSNGRILNVNQKVGFTCIGEKHKDYYLFELKSSDFLL